MIKYLTLIAFSTALFGLAHNAMADINVTESPEGIQEIAPSGSYLSPSFISDGSTGTSWQSAFELALHNFEFTLDADLDGTTGENGDIDDIYKLTSISLYSPGNTESLNRFILEAKKTSGSWQRIYSPQALVNPFNFIETIAGGIRAVNPPSYASSSARINDGVIGPGDANWLTLKSTSNKTFQFTFDPDFNGIASEVDDQFTLDSVILYSPGNNRAVKDFEIFVQNSGISVWKRLYSSQPFNFALTANKGYRAVDPPSYASSASRINDGVNGNGDANWLSLSKTNTFEFTFDPNFDGVREDSADHFTLDGIAIYSPGNSRSIKDFEIKVKTSAGWQPSIILQASATTARQYFAIGPFINVERVRFKTFTNYGNTFLQINEFQIMGNWGGDNPIFKGAQTSNAQVFDLSAQPINNDGRRDNITRLLFRPLTNYGNTFMQINEFSALGVWNGNNPIFKANKTTGKQFFDLASVIANNDGRRDDITRLRFKSVSNYGASYLRVNEFQAFGILTGNLPEEFNAFDSSTAPSSIKGALQTRLADNNTISFDVIALTADKTAVDATFTHDVKIELLANMANVATDSDKCPVTSTIISTLAATTITNGRSTVTMPQASNVWKKVYVRISYQPPAGALVVACALDRFSIRPAAFTLVAQHDDWETAGNSQQINAATVNANPTHKAGRPFSLQLKAVDSVGTTMSNYVDIPVIANSYPTLIAPGAGILGNLNLGTLANVNGVISSATASYSEVGIISLLMNDEDFAGIDALDGTTSINRTISSPTINIGRFVPDHFEVSASTNGTFDDSCTGFSYAGQLFTYLTTPELTVTAYNSASAITQNYTNNFAKLTRSDFSVTAPTTDAVKLSADGVNLVSLNWNPASSSLTDNSNGSLTFSFGIDAFNHLHDSNSRVSSYSNTVNLNFTEITDSDGIETQALPHILQPTGGLVRFGRINIANAHGSELAALPVTIKAEYFNGVDWTDNTSDQCTTLTLASQLQLANPETGSGGWLAGTTVMTIAGGSSAGSLSNNNPLSSGQSVLSLSAPGEDNQGYINIRSQISATDSWLLGDYDSDGLYDDEASARASFGLFQGSDTIIFRREVY